MDCLFDGREIIDLKTIASLPGRHNWQNACAAYAAARACGMAPDAIAERLASYPGLRHRQELVAIMPKTPAEKFDDAVDVALIVMFLPVIVPSTVMLVVVVINLLFNRLVTPRLVAHIARKHNLSEDAVQAAWDRLDRGDPV